MSMKVNPLSDELRLKSIRSRWKALIEEEDMIGASPSDSGILWADNEIKKLEQKVTILQEAVIGLQVDLHTGNKLAKKASQLEKYIDAYPVRSSKMENVLRPVGSRMLMEIFTLANEFLETK